MSGMTKGEV
jgi:hypothetical protein